MVCGFKSIKLIKVMRCIIFSTAVLLLVTSLRSNEIAGKLSSEDYDSIIKFENAIKISHDQLIKIIPNEFREKVLNLKSKEDFYKLEYNVQIWIQDKVINTADVNISEPFNVLQKRHNLHSDDYHSILLESFINRINSKELKLDDDIYRYALYWQENVDPPYKISPEGGGKINWIWKISSNERNDGIIHVGVDNISRRFICYEWNKGVYYPEGDSLERIRAEIVQNPNRAGMHIGIGYLNKVNEAKK
jgi:hypothetical protein